MAYKPILFNTEMVQAIHSGRKTKTRRVCKGQGECSPVQCGYHPPYKPGDILWVRETWQHVYTLDDNDQAINGSGRYIYFADNPMPFDYWVDADTGIHKEQMPWKPSIHMPKEAARIFLLVKAVRVERLQDITGEQAEKEGCSAGRFHITCGPFGNYDEPPEEFNAVEDFQRVWDTTIKPADRDKYGWIANPWVWVIEFERCEKPEGWV